MKKRILSILLLCALLCGILTMTACGKKIAELNSESDIVIANAGYFSFYVHWQRDYYKELLSMYNQDINNNIDSYFSETSTRTIREEILESARSDYLNFAVVTDRFDRLGLELTEEEIKSIEKTYKEDWIGTYGEDGMKDILKELKLSEEEFFNLISLEQKSNRIIEYYYGENGKTPITEEDCKKHYEENYLRFKYVLISTVDDAEKPLPEAEIAAKRTLANDLLAQLNAKSSTIEEMIKLHSEDYVKITDDMSTADRQSAEESNKTALNKGIISDLDGVFNKYLYTGYGICVHAKIIDKLQELEVGESAVVEIDNSIWVIQKFDLYEDPAYYDNLADSIFQALYSPSFSNMYTQWLADLNLQFNEKVLSGFEPGSFTDMFSKVYETETENNEKQ